MKDSRKLELCKEIKKSLTEFHEGLNWAEYKKYSLCAEMEEVIERELFREESLDFAKWFHRELLEARVGKKGYTSVGGDKITIGADDITETYLWPPRNYSYRLAFMNKLIYNLENNG